MLSLDRHGHLYPCAQVHIQIQERNEEKWTPTSGVLSRSLPYKQEFWQHMILVSAVAQTDCTEKQSTGNTAFLIYLSAVFSIAFCSKKSPKGVQNKQYTFSWVLHETHVDILYLWNNPDILRRVSEQETRQKFVRKESDYTAHFNYA